VETIEEFADLFLVGKILDGRHNIAG